MSDFPRPAEHCSRPTVHFSLFTLLELVVVLIVLVTVTGLTAPRLGSYLRGRGLDDEARRFWAVTRQARQEAILRSLPVVVRIDRIAGAYTLSAMPGYGNEVPTRTYTFPTHAELVLQADPTATPATIEMVWWSDGAASSASPAAIVLRDCRHTEDAWLFQRQATGMYALNREVAP